MSVFCPSACIVPSGPLILVNPRTIYSHAALSSLSSSSAHPTPVQRRHLKAYRTAANITKALGARVPLVSFYHPGPSAISVFDTAKGPQRIKLTLFADLDSFACTAAGVSAHVSPARDTVLLILHSTTSSLPSTAPEQPPQKHTFPLAVFSPLRSVASAAAAKLLAALPRGAAALARLAAAPETRALVERTRDAHLAALASARAAQPAAESESRRRVATADERLVRALELALGQPAAPETPPPPRGSAPDARSDGRGVPGERRCLPGLGWVLRHPCGEDMEKAAWTVLFADGEELRLAGEGAERVELHWRGESSRETVEGLEDSGTRLRLCSTAPLGQTRHDGPSHPAPRELLLTICELAYEPRGTYLALVSKAFVPFARERLFGGELYVSTSACLKKLMGVLATSPGPAAVVKNLAIDIWSSEYWEDEDGDRFKPDLVKLVELCEGSPLVLEERISSVVNLQTLEFRRGTWSASLLADLHSLTHLAKLASTTSGYSSSDLSPTFTRDGIVQVVEAATSAGSCVYADIDDPQNDSQELSAPAPLHHPTRGPHAHFTASTTLGVQRPADDDPFAPVSPSDISHASTRSPSRPRVPPHPASPLDPHARVPHDAGALFALEDATRDPFQPDPVVTSPPQSRSRSLSPTPTSSSSHAAPRPMPAASRSPPSSIASSGKGRLGASRSAIGTRSLMGLMGGTRYEGQGFPFGGVGVGEEDEEQDEEPPVGQDQRPRVRSRDDLQTIAASLPPPPSALSASALDESDEEEEDADAPPDFTARIPLFSSTHPSRHTHRVAHPHLSASSHGSSSHRRGPAGGIINGRRWAAGMNAKERALWRWVNVGDLDGFLQQVYLYYVGKGIWAIGLERTLNLLTVGWVIGFSTFLIGCIDYPRLWHSNHLSDVVIPRCTSRLSGFTLLLFIAFVAFYAWRVVRFGLGVRRLWDMHEFYTELLEVPESDIQTIPWHAIVARLSDLRANHPSALSSRTATGQPTERLDAHDVANRIMRQENYLIALFNKGLLDISLALPRPLRGTVGRALGKSRFGKSMLTQTLEWNLSFCVLGFLFGQDGQVRRAFLTERNKGELIEALRRRFILMGLINAVFAPFIVLYLLTYSFFRYFEEYHKNPSSIGSRQFTPLARWKFREFNELPHHFQQRLALAHPLADQYINHYPKAKTVLLSRFVAFLAGSFAAVLILFSLIDPDAFLHFEITPGRTVLFYIGVFGTVLAVARGMVPDENRVVDPEVLMRSIVEHTHYLPAEWKDKLHSSQVHLAFGKLFQMKIVLFMQEILSVLITPFVLWYSLPDCAGPVVDFFREFTVHVDGLGYVCSFAVFDFKRHGDTKFGAPVQETRDERWKSTEGKMEKSFLTFVASNPAWVPRDQTQSLFLSRMTEAAPPPHFSQLHPSSSTYAPHARHPSASAARARHRFAPGLALAEEPPSASAELRAEKARMYDRAFAQSALLAASASGGGARAAADMGAGVVHGLGPARRGRAPAPGTAGGGGTGAGVIDEESALDGEGFVAPTEAQPFGLPVSEDEDDAAELGEPGAEVERMRRRGLGGLMSEMMYQR
ncbi:hypothetical protein JCM3770_005318 [Rhodotorula araucariae]